MAAPSRTNIIVFSSVNYTNEASLMAAVLQQLTILLRAGYTCVVKDLSGRGTIIGIEYSNNDPQFGEPQVNWLYPDEMEYVQVYTDKVEYELAKRKQEELEYVNNTELFQVQDAKIPGDKGGNKNGGSNNGGHFDA